MAYPSQHIFPRLKRAPAFVDHGQPTGDIDLPFKKSKRSSGSFCEGENELMIVLDEAHNKIVKIHGEVEIISLTKWSSLDVYVEERMTSFTQLFETIIKSRNPNYNIQPLFDDDESTKSDKALVKGNTFQGCLSLLLNQLEKYRDDLSKDSLHKDVTSVESYETRLYNHYKTKVKGLSLPPPYKSDNDYSSPIPSSEFTLLEQWKEQVSLQSVEIQGKCQPLLKKAQEIYDRYRVIIESFPTCKERVHQYKALKEAYIPQLRFAKKGRRFQDEKHVLDHVKKSRERCAERDYDAPNPLWLWYEQAEKDGLQLPEVPCAVKTLVTDSQALHYCQGSYKGRRQKPTIEDKILITTIACRVNGKTHDLPLFAMFDGHTGDAVAIHCQKQLPQVFSAALAKTCEKGFTLDGIFNAVKDTCEQLHATAPILSGSTLLLTTCIQDVWYMFSVGDSRGMFFDYKALPMTFDSAAKDPYFQEKVCLRGGSIILKKGQHRIEEVNMNSTNSIGDKMFCGKISEDKLSQTPRGNFFEVPKESEKDLYLVLCTDGITQFASNGDLFRLADRSKNMEEFTKTVLQRAAHFNNGPGPGDDDYSIIVVKIKDKKTS